MKAMLSTAPGGAETLVAGELPAPEAGPGQVVLEVRAVGINYPDVLIIEDRYQFRPERPFAPGGEAAGVVVEVGPGAEGLAAGDRVAAVTGWGALAERVAAPAGACLKLPDDMDFETGAALLMTYGTALYALKDRGGLKSGETLLVLGAAGGVGAAAVELGKALGARVVAAVSDEAKATFARDLGADEAVIYPRGELDKAAVRTLSGAFKSACGGEGADVILDAVGGGYAEAALRASAWGGRLLVVGFPAGIPAIPLNLTLLKSAQIVGVFWGAHVAREPGLHAANMARLLELWREGRIRPRVSRTFPFQRAGEAIAALGERRALGKLVVTVP